MDSSELVEEPPGVKLKRKIAQALRPAGVFLHGFLHHTRKVR